MSLAPDSHPNDVSDVTVLEGAGHVAVSDVSDVPVGNGHGKLGLGLRALARATYESRNL